MTEQEKYIISLIVNDEQTGNHLLRNPEDWQKLNIDIDEYIKIKDEIELAISNFKWDDTDISSYREKELLIYYKCCHDYDFYEVMN